jgi:hypothetical protein
MGLFGLFMADHLAPFHTSTSVWYGTVVVLPTATQKVRVTQSTAFSSVAAPLASGTDTARQGAPSHTWARVEPPEDGW